VIYFCLQLHITLEGFFHRTAETYKAGSSLPHQDHKAKVLGSKKIILLISEEAWICLYAIF
jgi:hypothetical protein